MALVSWDTVYYWQPESTSLGCKAKAGSKTLLSGTEQLGDKITPNTALSFEITHTLKQTKLRALEITQEKNNFHGFLEN